MDIAGITSAIEEMWRATTKHYETLVDRTITKTEWCIIRVGAVVDQPIIKERRKRLAKGERKGNEWVNSPNCLLKSNIQPQKRKILEENAGDKREETKRKQEDIW